jgi:hypothetical protein
MLNLFKKSIFSIVILFFLASCGALKDRNDSAKKQPVNASERVKQNIKEGKGLRLSTSVTNSYSGSGSFLFASSNPLWRATLEKLDFIPLANVDYAGGIIITDWYGDTESNEEIKVAVRFLTNEIRSDAIDVVIYKKKCVDTNKCQTSKVENNTNNKIKASILKRAAVLSKEAESKKDE